MSIHLSSSFGGHSHLPATALMRHGRPGAARIVRRWYAVEEYGADRVPATGPVVIAANHVSFVDGPLLSILCRRPVHSLTKVEMFHGPMKPFLHASGQIPVHRYEADIAAIRTSLAVLGHGGVLGVFPEGTRGRGDLEQFAPGAAYLAMVAGAPVVPLIYLGTRLPGSGISSVPPRGTRMAMTYGEPVQVASVPWPRRRPDVRAVSDRIHAALVDTLQTAQRRTGLTLPGPVRDQEEQA